MDGVILFVDDKVHQCRAENGELKRTSENQLFEDLRKEYPVLGVKNLEFAKRAIKSIGSFSAIILDWKFNDEESNDPEDNEALEFVQAPSLKEDQTLRFLEDNDFYSLVYVYSTVDVESKYGERLTERFGKRIQFQEKTLASPAKDIAQEIKEWSEENQNLSIPLVWTATINQAIQQIFKELSYADANWVRELGASAQADRVSGQVFVIEILQILLAEMLVQNEDLLKSIGDYLSANDVAPAKEEAAPAKEEAAPAKEEAAPAKEESVAKLFRRLLYTKLNQDAPTMTGDICELGENKFGVIVTPECDIKDVLDGNTPSFELLTFSRDGFDDFLKRNRSYERKLFAEKSSAKIERLGKIFNQEEGGFHILPSFPFDDASFNLSAAIDFSQGCERLTVEQLKNTRKYKLNGPFIQQLRQRYISHLGRVGVPSLPPSLRDFNLK